jgi:branched-chain amino acid transport system substrate-binding protein
MLRRAIATAVFGLFAVALGGLPAQAADPIRIGLGMAQTGPLAANGKSALLAMESGATTSTPRAGCWGAR